MNQAKKLKDTLNLPQTDFLCGQMPLKMNHKESGIGRIQSFIKNARKNKGAESFILHDGLPLQMEMFMSARH